MCRLLGKALVPLSSTALKRMASPCRHGTPQLWPRVKRFGMAAHTVRDNVKEIKATIGSLIHVYNKKR